MNQCCVFLPQVWGFFFFYCYCFFILILCILPEPLSYLHSLEDSQTLQDTSGWCGLCLCLAVSTRSCMNTHLCTLSFFSFFFQTVALVCVDSWECMSELYFMGVRCDAVMLSWGKQWPTAQMKSGGPSALCEQQQMFTIIHHTWPVCFWPSFLRTCYSILFNMMQHYLLCSLFVFFISFIKG